MFHDLIYDEYRGSLRCLIDRKSKSTWIFRILKECGSVTVFHCHVMRTAEHTCYIEITHSDNSSSDLSNLIACKELFKYLGFTTLLYKRSISGKIKQILIKE